MNFTRGAKSSSAAATWATKAVGLAVFLLAGYLTADLAVLWSRQYMLPQQAPPSRPRSQGLAPRAGGSFESIVTRNIFNSDGVIPEPLIAKQGPGQQQEELPPIPSQLPINLVGTLVHSNPERSLAALEVKGKNQVASYRPKMDIDSLATLEKVERMKIIFRNKNTGRLEFIEMKNAPKSMARVAGPKPGSSDVRKVSDTEFEIKRADLLKYTNDLPSVLMQARVIAARRGGSGDVYGFRLVEMQPNSIYSQLGLQVMDVLTGVNGTPVTSPQQAMELYNTLRSANSVELSIERGGRNQTLKYKIAN